MSRRDEVVDSLGSLLHTFQRDLSAALAPPPTATGDNSTPPRGTAINMGRRLSSALASAIDPAGGAGSGSVGPPSSSSSRAFEPHSLPTSNMLDNGAPHASSSHQVMPLPWEHPDERDDDERSFDQEMEVLPSYSRRAPGHGGTTARLPPMRMHHITSRSQKLRLEIEAPGAEGRIVMMQREVEGKVFIEGTLSVTLPTPEALTFIRIKAKGVVRTMVMKVHGSGRHPVTDEAVICEDNLQLWDPETFLANNESTDPTKLQGSFVFPFKLEIPPRINIHPLEVEGGPPVRRTRPTPPSFVLQGSHDGASIGKGAEWASIRFVVKVTMGRKGLLKVNERFLIPFIYVPRHAEPDSSPARLLALAEGRPTPSPQEDPTGWSGRKFRHPVKRGLIAGKKAWYEAAVLVPAPGAFTRLTSIPFAVKITSSDPNVTTRFPAGSGVTCFLIQRAYVIAQGLTNTHDIAVATGTIEDDGPAEGIAVPRDLEGEADPAVWVKRFKGEIPLSKLVGSSFRAPNLAVQFVVSVYLSVPGTGNDCEITVPVQIVSAIDHVTPAAPIDPLAPPPLSLDTTTTTASAPIPIGGETSTAGANGQRGEDGAPFSPDELGLPPSYFDVLEQRARGET